jgi:hypothetical protein
MGKIHFTFNSVQVNELLRVSDFAKQLTILNYVFKFSFRTFRNFCFVLFFKFQKQLLAQQPGIDRAFPFGISRQICFFSEVGLPDQCPRPFFT